MHNRSIKTSKIVDINLLLLHERLGNPLKKSYIQMYNGIGIFFLENKQNENYRYISYEL